jgi:chromosome segregation ATPase
MKAKRKVKAGLWRIIPGNHPSDRVLVEVPSNDLSVRSNRAGTALPAQAPEQQPEHATNSLAERLLDELAAARARNDNLTDKLIEAKDVLTAAYSKLITLNQDLVSARIELLAVKDEVIGVKEAHGRDERELVAAEMREMGTKAELERALADISELKTRLSRAQRPWWR